MIFGVLAAFLVSLFVGDSVNAQDQNYVPGVHTLQVTIGSGVTRVSATSIPVKQVMFQNNAAHNCRVGDSNTSTTRGGLLSGSASPPGGSLNSGLSTQTSSDLNQWWIAGTQNDVIDVIYIQ